MPERAALIAVLIMDRPLCMGCIASKSGLVAAEIEVYLNTIQATLEVQRGVDRCRVCGNSTTVYSLSRTEPPSSQ